MGGQVAACRLIMFWGFSGTFIVATDGLEELEKRHLQMTHNQSWALLEVKIFEKST